MPNVVAGGAVCALRAVADMVIGSGVAYFFGGLALANAVPHFVSGVMGRPFQSPFAKPPGVGLSSSLVNVSWGSANFAVAYLLVSRGGTFDARELGDVVPLGAGIFASAMFSAYHFGRFHGGNPPAD